MNEKSIQVGGQAVIEGVMMRSRETVSVAVRRRDGSIYVKNRPYESFVKRYRVLSIPVLRGAVVLIESLVLGVQALSFSGDVAMEDEKHAENRNDEAEQSEHDKSRSSSKLWLAATVLFSFVIGLFIFFYIPLLLTEWLGAEGGFMFNLVDGVLRLAIFLLYLFAITLMKDIRRVFEYHGAEHKSIFAFEKDKQLIATEAAAQSRFHPRCGTSFLLIVMIVSVFVFMFLGKPQDIGDRLFRLAFIPLIGGISYELIRLSDAGANKSFWRPFILPGLWLQRLTTREPDESQIEVAIIALKCALGIELDTKANVVFDGNSAIKLEAMES